MTRDRSLLLSLVVAAALCRATPALALPDVTLWVIQPPGELVAFDLSDFTRIGGVRIPPAAFNDPQKIAINGHGQFLVQLDDEHLWLWDGASNHTLPAVARKPTAHVPAQLRQWLLGDDGKSLFVLEGAAKSPEEAIADTAPTPLIVRETDLSQRPRRVVFSRWTRPCEITDEPGTDDPCPAPIIWAPGGVVKNHFLLVHWEPDSSEPGQEGLPLGSSHRVRYQRSRGEWQAVELDQWVDAPPLDANADGSLSIEAPGDESNYGVNEVSNQVIWRSTDTSRVVFDEWSSLHNEGYAVNFLIADAHIAPNGHRVAYTVRASASATDSIAASEDGHPDPSQLPMIRSAVEDAPWVEVIERHPGSVRPVRLPHAEMVGWASDSEIVVIERGRVVAIDVATLRRRRSDIRVRTVGDAFVIWR
jgi:hypothetical protein